MLTAWLRKGVEGSAAAVDTDNGDGSRKRHAPVEGGAASTTDRGESSTHVGYETATQTARSSTAPLTENQPGECA